MQNIERTYGVDEAISLLLSEFRHLGLRSELVPLGHRVPSYRCFLFDQSDDEVSIGNGKGRGPQARASALYEALEHLVSTASHQRLTEQVPIRVVASMSLASAERAIQLMQKHSSPDAVIPCREYTSIANGSTIYYPLFLTQPDYFRAPFDGDRTDYRSLSKYSTNNGCAIGATAVEALIHGLCELVERDALSCFLISTFVTRDAPAVKVIDRGSLPVVYRSLIEEIESDTQGIVEVIDMTSDLEIPACLALLRDEKSVLPYVGSGSSLHYGYALERAVLEAQQSLHLHTAEMESESHAILHRFSSLSRYRNCLTLDTSRSKVCMVHYRALPDHFTPGDSLNSYLDHLIRLLSQKGYSPYYAVNYRGHTGITCVQCLVPGLERFHLVRAGMEVLPSDRGKRLVKPPLGLAHLE